MPEWLVSLLHSLLFWQLSTSVLTFGLALSLWYSVRVRKREKKNKGDATTDHLTGLANRRVLDARLQEHAVMSSRYRVPISIALVDLDFLKEINDTLGHPAGDTALRLLATALSGVITREADLAAKYSGGDEFALLLYDCSEEGARSVTDKLLQRIQTSSLKNGQNISASIGVLTFYPEKGVVVSPQNLLDSVDKALLTAKRAGKNRAYFVSEGTPRA